jgi:hypothetical protein
MINLDDRIFKEGIVAKIKPNAFTVLLAIATHLGKDDTCFPSNKRLEEITGLGREAVQNAKKTLEKFGLIKYGQIKKEGSKFSHTEYTVNTDLISVFVPAKNTKPLTGQPSPGEPLTGEPESGNTLLSINQEGSINNTLSIKETPVEDFSTKNEIPKKEETGEVKVVTSSTKLTTKELESDFAFVLAGDIFWLYLMQNEGQKDMMRVNTRFSGTDEDLKELVYKFFADKADQNFVLQTPCQRSNLGAITKWMSNQKSFKQPSATKVIPLNPGTNQPKKAGQLTEYQNQVENGEYVIVEGRKISRATYQAVMARHAPTVGSQ